MYGSTNTSRERELVLSELRGLSVSRAELVVSPKDPTTDFHRATSRIQEVVH